MEIDAEFADEIIEAIANELSAAIDEPQKGVITVLGALTAGFLFCFHAFEGLKREQAHELWDSITTSVNIEIDTIYDGLGSKLTNEEKDNE